MKNLKTIIAPVIFSSPLLTLSCTYDTNNVVHNNQKLSKQVINNNVEEAKWKNFINQDYIQALLKNVYKNNLKEKEEYIKSQMNIKDTYLNDIKWAFYYGSNNVRQYRSDGSSAWYMPKTDPLLFQKSDKLINEFSKKNWLFYLYHFNNLKFIYYPNNVDRFESSRTDTDYNTRENAQKLGAFYSPKTNDILEYTTQVYEDSETYKEISFYMLTKEGFIVNIDITDSNPKDNKSIPEVSVFGYIFTYPKLISDKELLKHFSLKEYVVSSQSFSELRNNKTSEILFKDKYGGSILRYCIYGINTEPNS